MTQPVPKRGPGRPRKVPVETPKEPVEAPKPEPKKPADGRIGEDVGDDRIHFVSFSDGSEYRCENGVIVERVV